MGPDLRQLRRAAASVHPAADIDEDDWVEFGLMGAYTQASLTPFNGFDRRDQYWGR